MTSNLQNQLSCFISPGLVSKLSKIYFENEALLTKAIEASVCAVLMGLYNRIEDVKLYDELMQLIANSEFYGGINFESKKVQTLNNSFDEEGHGPLNIIFVNKKDRIAEMISNEVGVRSETACALLNLSVMVVLSYFKNKNKNLKELQLLLEEQKNKILNATPQGIRLILGFSTFEIIEEHSQTSFTSNIFSFFSIKKQTSY